MTAAADDAEVLRRPPVSVDFALQGGGAHGAFTWGVLDRLLEEPWLQIVGISGTSAGAMNAAVLVHGWTEGQAAGARAALDHLGRGVRPPPPYAPRHGAPLPPRPGGGSIPPSPAYIFTDLMSRVLSP